MGAEISAWLEEFILVCVHQGRRAQAVFLPFLFFTSAKYFAFLPIWSLESGPTPPLLCWRKEHTQVTWKTKSFFISLYLWPQGWNCHTQGSSPSAELRAWNVTSRWDKSLQVNIVQFLCSNGTYVGAVMCWNVHNCTGLSQTGRQLGHFLAHCKINWHFAPHFKESRCKRRCS